MTSRTSTVVASRVRSAGGFTLIELLVTIAIAAILTLIAAPSFTQYQRNSELSRSASAFLGTMMAVRAEAMKRQLNGMVRPCSTCGGDWAKGWQGYVDGDWDFMPGGATDVAVLNQDALPSGVSVAITSPNTIPSDATSTYVLFNGAGYAQTTSYASFSTAITFSNVAGSRVVIISPSGRMRVCNPVTDTTCTTASTF